MNEQDASKVLTANQRGIEPNMVLSDKKEPR